MQAHAILAKALSNHDIHYSFGIVGIPVIELGFSLQAEGIQYYGFRNEQQAAYAAGIIGFLTQKPGICLCVSGPGHTNAISGLANAWSNCWPMILLSGASELGQTSFQAFQECSQEYLVRPFCKYSVRITDASSIPYHVEKAVRLSTSGRPGPVYIELPGDVLKQIVQEKDINWKQTPIEVPLYLPPDNSIKKAVEALRSAKNPLIIVGKGAAYGKASEEVIELVNITKIPFLPTPMGKGVVPDSHPQNISAARSTALSNSDVVLLIGARLNWILHFGLPKRFAKDVKFIQIDICPEEMSHNVTSVTHLAGDCKLTVERLNTYIKESRWQFPLSSEWNSILAQKVQQNVGVSNKLMNTKAKTLTYYTSGRIIQSYLPKDCYLINEGANTMDIGRTIYTHELPARRLDAGSFGTMGIGIPFVLAAKAFAPKTWVVAVMGDSAFGFSAMECETLTRYRLGGVIFIINNNNGIYSGVDKLQGDPQSFPVTGLNPDVKYEMLADAFGGKGYKVVNEEELEKVCKGIFQEQNLGKLLIVNVAIDPYESKKPQENEWLTTSEPKPKI